MTKYVVLRYISIPKIRMTCKSIVCPMFSINVVICYADEWCLDTQPI